MPCRSASVRCSSTRRSSARSSGTARCAPSARRARTSSASSYSSSSAISSGESRRRSSRASSSGPSLTSSSATSPTTSWRGQTERDAMRSSRSSSSVPQARRWRRSVRSRQEVVGDITDEDVSEGPLVLALDDRRRLSPDEIAELELFEDALDVSARRVDGAQRAVPEALADDRRVEEQRTLALWQGIEARGDDPADARRQGSGRRLLHRRCELLDEERVALGDTD